MLLSTARAFKAKNSRHIPVSTFWLRPHLEPTERVLSNAAVGQHTLVSHILTALPNH